VFAGGAGLLIGTSPLGDAIGVVLVVGFVVSLGMFVRAQWPTAAAVSTWFEVRRMRWLPRMTPQRFDEWRHLRRLMTPDERLAADRASHQEPDDAAAS
jgi:hypothetical protein